MNFKASHESGDGKIFYQHRGLYMQGHKKKFEWIITIISLLIFLATPVVMAESGSHTTTNASMRVEKKRPIPIETDFTISAGYRVDDLDWNIAGDSNGNNPNVLSELTWEDVESYQVKLQGNIVWPNIIAIRGYANYGWIFDGDNQDSDYLQDNRTFEFSRSNNSTDDDYVRAASLAIGYPVRFGLFAHGTLTPLLGYSLHEQKLNITDGNQTIPNQGPFPGLDSTYEAEWKGPWIGLDFRVKATELTTFAHRFETYFTYEYHWADYYAEADWNLRDDFAHPISFEHNADGNGWKIGTGFNLWFHRNWALNFNYDYQDWSTDSGTDKVFFADGSTAKTRLNEVNWTSYALSLGISLRF
jgi:Protochlamydia outer membrane protein